MNRFALLLTIGVAGISQARPDGIAGLHFTAGIKGGFPMTDPYENVTRVGMVQASADPFVEFVTPTVETFSKSKDYVVGPTLELFLPLHLSVEADGLYRPLTLGENINYQNLPAGPPLNILPTGPIHSELPPDAAVAHGDSSWEVSLLPKFRIPVPVPFVQPFIATGPSFRVSSVPFLSANGWTGAVGADFHVWKLHAGPDLRFTHWGADSTTAGSTRLVRSNQNQLELLLGLSF